MDFLVLSRAAPAAVGDDPLLNEQHWTYMDHFAESMTARGPTLGPDRTTWTGSMHVVSLPDPEAVRAFVADEPYHRAGLFRSHLIHRFTNLLGRTMWDYDGPPDEPRFLVLAGGSGSALPPGELQPGLRDRLILYGKLRTLDDDEPAGLALALQAPSREAVDALLAGLRARLGDVEVHDWEFGGRR